MHVHVGDYETVFCMEDSGGDYLVRFECTEMSYAFDASMNGATKGAGGVTIAVCAGYNF